MKKIALAAALSIMASATLAGGLSEPVVEPVVAPVQVEEATSSAGGILVPLLALIIVAAVAS